MAAFPLPLLGLAAPLRVASRTEFDSMFVYPMLPQDRCGPCRAATPPTQPRHTLAKGRVDA